MRSACSGGQRDRGGQRKRRRRRPADQTLAPPAAPNPTGTCLVGRWDAGLPRVEKALAAGLRRSGHILLLSGGSGSLAAVMKAVGVRDVLGRYQSAGAWAPLLVVGDRRAAALQGRVDGGLRDHRRGPAPSLGIDPVLITLAAGAGSLSSCT